MNIKWINTSKSFSLIEIIFVLVLISIISSFTITKTKISKLKLAKKQIIMHLKYMRYIALIDNKYEHNNTLWYRKSWNLKFRRCNNSNGVHYYIYSDLDNNGHVKESETLKDPLTNQYIYSTTACNDDTKRTNYTLLSKHFDIQKIDISCNNTNSLGQILFLNNGVAYSKFDKNNIHKYKIIKTCIISLINSNNEIETINIEGNTGIIY